MSDITEGMRESLIGYLNPLIVSLKLKHQKNYNFGNLSQKETIRSQPSFKQDLKLCKDIKCPRRTCKTYI